MILGKTIDQFVLIDHESMWFLKKLFHCFFQPLQNFRFVWHQCTILPPTDNPPFVVYKSFYCLLFRFTAAIIKLNNNLIISLLTFILFSCPWQLWLYVCIDISRFDKAKFLFLLVWTIITMFFLIISTRLKCVINDISHLLKTFF